MRQIKINFASAISALASASLAIYAPITDTEKISISLADISAVPIICTPLVAINDATKQARNKISLESV